MSERMRERLRWIGACSSALVATAVVAGALAVNAYYASNPAVANSSRVLRFHVIAEHDILEGYQIARDDLEERLGWVTDSDGLFIVAEKAAGQFARETIPQGAAVHRKMVTRQLQHRWDESAALATVQIKQDVARLLKPGMYISFVRQQEIEDGAGEMTLKQDPLNRERFEVKEVAQSRQDANMMAITIVIPGPLFEKVGYIHDDSRQVIIWRSKK